MWKFATKLALSLAVFGAMISPTLAGSPKGMKSGPSLGSSSQSTLGSALKPINSRPALNTAPNLGGIKTQGTQQRFDPGKINLTNKVISTQILDIKSIREIKPLKPIDPVFGNGGINPANPLKTIKPIDPGFGNGKPIVDHVKPIKPFPVKQIVDHVKPIHGGTFPKNCWPSQGCWPNQGCGPKTWWGCGSYGGVFGGLFGCCTPGYGCGTNNPMPYPYWVHCHSWINYCPSYCTPICVDSFPVVSTIVINAAATAVPVAPDAPVGTVDLLIEGVTLLDVGDTSKNLGPVIRVVVSNRGSTPAGPFALGVYASLKEVPSNEMIPAGEMLDGLAPGMSRPVDVRLPVEVFGMATVGSPVKEPFKQLFLVADVENTVVESSKQNNILPVKREQLVLR